MITYADSGVDIEKGAEAVELYKEKVKATFRPEVIGDLGGFGGLFSIEAAKDMKDPILVSGTDGVGTKLELARRIGRNDTVGIDLVAMCANDVVTCGAEPLFFLDYMSVGCLDPYLAAEIVGGIADGCNQAGCALIGGETAEHPGVMPATDYDLAGFCVGIIDRDKMITPDLVCEHDTLIGLASSGFHSNGYSLIRKVCEDEIGNDDLLYRSFDGREFADCLIEPTRIYVKPILSLIKKYPDAIHGIAHITGGGITENLNRILPSYYDAHVDFGNWKIPAIIEYVCKKAGLSTEEALKTFNMGIGMVLAVDLDYVQSVCENLKADSIEPITVGTVSIGSGKVQYFGI